MLVKVESCTLKKSFGNIAKVAFLGNVPKGSEAEIVKQEYGLDLFMIHQLHSNCVVTLDNQTNIKNVFEGDAIVTKKSKIAIGIVTADCVPIVFIDVKNSIIAAAHAGWRGARYGIIENTINGMLSLNASSEIIAVIGPCIHQASYTVQYDLVDNFISENKDNDVFFKIYDSKILFDLPSYVKNKLHKKNISQIYDVEIDTFSSKSFSSHRREKSNRKGNNVALIMLNGNECDVFSNIMSQNNNIKVLNNNKFDSFSNEIDVFSNSNEYFSNVNLVNNLFNDDQSFELLSSKETKQIYKNIESGKVKIMAKLDLHGYDTSGAFLALENFIFNNFNNSVRYLLVITGKGRNYDSILKTSFMNWIENNENFKKRVLTYIQSSPNHGGDGAFYLILKKKDRVDFS